METRHEFIQSTYHGWDIAECGNNAFYVIKGEDSDRPSVPSLVPTVEGGATTRVLNASFNIPGSVNKRREKEVKKEED